jgi:hypothetical protein
MRVGGFFSLMAHAAVVAAGMVVAPSAMSDVEMMPVINVDLVSIAEETNLAPITEQAKEDDLAQEMKQEEVPAAEPPPPPKEEETVPVEEPKAKPAPKPKEKSAADELAGILSAIPDKKPQPKRTAAAETPTNLRDVPDAGARAGYGRQTANTVTIRDFISSQLISNRCWTDHSDMADAHRLRTVIRVRFGRNGRFLEEPQMIEPSRPPTNDQVLQVYIQHAFTALNKCNTLGFAVPKEYFETQPAQYIDLVFLPKIAAQR